MSFNLKIKDEICKNRPKHKARLVPTALGLLIYSRHFAADRIQLTTEHMPTAKLFVQSVSSLVRLEGSLTTREYVRGGRLVIQVLVDHQRDCSQIYSFAEDHMAALPTEEQGAGAFIAGAFLACGQLFDPTKSYRLEFSVPNGRWMHLLVENLSVLSLTPKVVTRRGEPVLYFKESEQIEELLTHMNAVQSSMELMGIKIYKDVRNKVNRVTNCETANIGKTVTAAMSQIEDIEYLISRGELEQLPIELQEVAVLRLQSPELSLRELGQQLSEPLSRSGVNHRLNKISERVTELRQSVASIDAVRPKSS